jgi:IclR family acetate operon transcriptional repressor
MRRARAQHGDGDGVVLGGHVTRVRDRGWLIRSQAEWCAPDFCQDPLVPQGDPVSNYTVPAVVSASQVLSYLAEEAAGGATQSEVARAVGLSKSTAHNLLRTLEAVGWVHRDEARVYHLGSRLIGLGAAATRRVSVIGLAVRRMAALPVEHGLSFAVAQLTPDGDAQVVERLYPTTDEHVGVAVGSRYGDHAGALGKAMLALLPREEAARAIARDGLTSYTPRTIVDPAALLADVDEVRARGWAASEGELNDNHAVVGFAASSDPRQQVFLLALGFPSQLPHELTVRLGEELAAIAVELNRQAGLLPPTSSATTVG